MRTLNYKFWMDLLMNVNKFKMFLMNFKQH